GNITPADPLLDPAIRARYSLSVDDKGNVIANPVLDPVLRNRQPVYLFPSDPTAKNAPADKDNLDQLNQVLERLQQLQKSRPDAKELRELIDRLRAWTAKNPVQAKGRWKALYDLGVVPLDAKPKT